MTIQPLLDRLHAQTIRHHWLQLFTAITRGLLAAGFIPSGLTKILGHRFTIMPPETPIGYFFDALYQSGFYYRFIGFAQVFVAILILIPRFTTIGAIVYFPVILNIFVITVSLGFRGTPFITALMLLGSIYLLYWDYDKLKQLMTDDDPKVAQQGLRDVYVKAQSKRGVFSIAVATCMGVVGLYQLGIVWIQHMQGMPLGVQTLGIPLSLISAAAALICISIFRVWRSR